MNAPVRGSTTAFGIPTISGFASDMYAALPTKNPTRRLVQLAVRTSWLPSLLASLTRVTVLGSLHLATAPQRFASRVDSDLAHAALKGADLQGLIASWGKAL